MRFRGARTLDRQSKRQQRLGTPRASQSYNFRCGQLPRNARIAQCGVQRWIGRCLTEVTEVI